MIPTNSRALWPPPSVTFSKAAPILESPKGTPETFFRIQGFLGNSFGVGHPDSLQSLSSKTQSGQLLPRKFDMFDFLGPPSDFLGPPYDHLGPPSTSDLSFLVNL